MKGAKAGDNYSISRDLIKHTDDVMIRGLHAVPNTRIHSSTINPDWKMVVLVWKLINYRQDYKYCSATPLSVLGKMLTHLLDRSWQSPVEV